MYFLGGHKLAFIVVVFDSEILYSGAHWVPLFLNVWSDGKKFTRRNILFDFVFWFLSWVILIRWSKSKLGV